MFLGVYPVIASTFVGFTVLRVAPERCTECSRAGLTRGSMRPDLSGDGDLVADYPFFKRKGTATIREKKLQPPMFVLNVNERGCSFSPTASFV